MRFKWLLLLSLIFFIFGQYYYCYISFHIGLLFVIISSTLFMLPFIKYIVENEKNENRNKKRIN